MRNLLRGAALSAMFCGTAAAADIGDVVFRNDLAACVTVEAATTRIEANIVSTDARFRLHRPIGACGCFSALATYTSSVNDHGTRQIVNEGLISIKDGDRKRLVLAAEPALITGRNVQVRLTCARPS